MADHHVLQIAAKVAADAHAGQVDLLGEPYLCHVFAVAGAVEGADAVAVALLHDVVEDTPVSLADLAAEGIPERIILAVDALTKRKGESYAAYLERIKKDDLAVVVKYADVKHNYSRVWKLDDPEVQARLLEKYSLALRMLEGWVSG